VINTRIHGLLDDDLLSSEQVAMARNVPTSLDPDGTQDGLLTGIVASRIESLSRVARFASTFHRDFAWSTRSR
jgi:hypothetical protein